jgi:hypothetical protein
MSEPNARVDVIGVATRHIFGDIRRYAKAQATPPQPSPTAAGEGADPRKHRLLAHM